MQKNTFEDFIIQCCRAKEWDLRDYLKNILSNNGFRIIEDDYKTYRGEKYSNVHNMLAIRGTPKVCLVAHTDVCRDHVDDNQIAEPVIKLASVDGDEPKEVIQDKDVKVQVGGDDRLGIAINVWTAMHTKKDIGLLFTTDEEIGLVSAEYVKIKELLDFDLLAQVDRGNHSSQLVTKISGTKLCSDETAKRLIQISKDIELPRYEVDGFLTDVLCIKNNNMCKDAVNMTCGYHNSYGSGSTEFIDVQEARDTMKYVTKIVQNYNENIIDDDSFIYKNYQSEVLQMNILEEENNKRADEQMFEMEKELFTEQADYDEMQSHWEAMLEQSADNDTANEEEINN